MHIFYNELLLIPTIIINTSHLCHILDPQRNRFLGLIYLSVMLIWHQPPMAALRLLIVLRKVSLICKCYTFTTLQFIKDIIFCHYFSNFLCKSIITSMFRRKTILNMQERQERLFHMLFDTDLPPAKAMSSLWAWVVDTGTVDVYIRSDHAHMLHNDY